MIYALIICLIIIGFLGYFLLQKRKHDNELQKECQRQLDQIREKINYDARVLDTYESKLLDVQIKVNTEKQKLTDLYNELDSAQTSLHDARDEYNHLVNDRMKELDTIFEETSARRMEQLKESCEEAKSKYDLQLKEYEEKRLKQTEDIKNSCIEAENQYFEECKKIRTDTEHLRERYEALLEPIKSYLKEKQEKFFYTIQLPDEFKEDIEFLLTTVASKVQHPDIISKLVWAEYVKPNLDNTFKRIEIKPEAGIYKLTSLETGMTYIGKSTNVKNRIADHFKSSIGIKSIADQAVHHAILKEGFWNWTIEVITYADKDRLNELEKYYIEFFKAQEYGYNKTGGG